MEKAAIVLNNIDFLMDKFCTDIKHANQVKNLTLLLFDKTEGVLHDFIKEDRKKLEMAALLHDLGHFYGPEKHHKQTFEIIKNNAIANVCQIDLLIIANIARYHRGKLPDKKHVGFMNLPSDKDREQVEALSAFLRIADGLDKNHLSLVSDLECTLEDANKILFIDIIASNQADLIDMNTLSKKKILFEKVFGTQVVFRLN